MKETNFAPTSEGNEIPRMCLIDSQELPKKTESTVATCLSPEPIGVVLRAVGMYWPLVG